ncbi:50S ribosomal protein L4 [Candidatus Peregrinibacteria bacterium CG11_big_fil_rev_8_21_14_0_20_41_10]|nr:MAG: 50S ribosomal protein L4 [Candidatus Peregrinibacteria bacterium CG11_big_fil_rev_8_21_14_0_20_41_10]PIZ76759.1 MAG: 50S ribosomal protein L4 [Candidatus Peregrinibacteria bacterium CG_4_10_14_0_2_um_filter_41_8]PJC37962.1 MAG: 50S ribosomal protein L4 [Candidatus Peregrinibacteria bacterium CG_4_9_14_0_2_um_filter_41_14]
MQVIVYDQKGKEVEKLTLNEQIFGIVPNEELVHQALVRQHANARIATAQVKGRSDVRGGGRKPYRQKGTGRARQGSIRAPHYVGGGVVFGPTTDRNYTKQMPKKQRRKALFSALSSKAAANAIIVLDKYVDKDEKTKNFATTLSLLPMTRNALVVTDRQTKDLINRVSGNLPEVKTILTQYLNIADLLKYRTIIFLKDSLLEIDSIFLNQ